MNILIIGKYPPIEGGVARNNYYFAKTLAEDGNEVHVVTNAFEVEQNHRLILMPEDAKSLEPVSTKGLVQLWSTENLGEGQNHIPQGDMFVTKLTSLASQVCKNYKIDVLLVSYLEPYAVAGSLVSTWFNIPSLFIHAGSDLGRLIKRPELKTVYQEILKRFDVIGTNLSRHKQLTELGIDKHQIHPAPSPALDVTLFNSQAKILNYKELFKKINMVSDKYTYLNESRAEKIISSKYIIGMYSKLGHAKGSFDLIEALALLKEEMENFHFVYITGGRPEALSTFEKQVHKLKLSGNITMIPFIANWHIPSFINSTTLMLFLENGFDIKSHSPIIPAEILMCNKALIISDEVYEKQLFFKNSLRENENVLVVDPADHLSLKNKIYKILTDTQFRNEIEIGSREVIKNLTTKEEQLASLYEILEYTKARFQAKNKINDK